MRAIVILLAPQRGPFPLIIPNRVEETLMRKATVGLWMRRRVNTGVIIVCHLLARGGKRLHVVYLWTFGAVVAYRIMENADSS